MNPPRSRFVGGKCSLSDRFPPRKVRRTARAGARVLVYGPYPPYPGPEAAATLATVRSLLAEGADVVTVSPLPSGAHHHADVAGLRGSLRFARHVLAARPGRVVAHLDASLLRIRRGGRKEEAARRLLGLALRGATVHLDAVSGRLDRRYVDLALRRAALVTVAGGGDGDALAAAGPGPARVAVRAPEPPPGAGERVAAPARPPWPEGDGATREALEAEVRRRAAADRAAGAGGLSAPGRPGAPGAPAGPLGRISPYHAAAPVGSPRLLARMVKQVVWRLTRFELEPVVDQLNLVHRAATEATEAQGRPDGSHNTA